MRTDRYPNYHRATRQAYRTLLAVGANQLPIDITAICRACKRTRVMSFREARRIIGDDFDPFWDGPSRYALTIRRDYDGETYYLILWNDEEMSPRDGLFRFSLAHELGHIVLKHDDGRSPAEEQEANCFAQHLLCPRPVLEAARPRDQVDISYMCGVSYSTATIVARQLRQPNPLIDGDTRTGIAEAFGLREKKALDDYMTANCMLLTNIARRRAGREEFQCRS